MIAIVPLLFGLLLAPAMAGPAVGGCVGCAPLGCPAILAAAGASLKFGVHAGHAIHSIRVADLQVLKPNVTADNKVPTCNEDISVGADPVLPSAPDNRSPRESEYLTDGTKIVDYILSRPKWASIEDKLMEIYHSMHMRETIYEALPEYRKLEANPPSAAVCACAVDNENNGVLTMLGHVCILMKEPCDNNKYLTCPCENPICRKYGYGLARPEDPLSEDYRKYMTGLDMQNPFVSAGKWEEYQKYFGPTPMPQAAKDIALFFYCSLN